MAVVSEMPKTKEVGSMSLAEMRDYLGKFRREGKLKAGDRAKLERKMKEILGRLAKLGQRGGQFAEIRLSAEAKALCKRIC